MMKKYEDKNISAVTYSSIGQNHIDKNIENQDSIEFNRLDDDTWYMVVADGVSSASNAKVGSLAAVRCVKEITERIKYGALETQNVDQVRKEYFKQWKNSFTEQWDTYATTVNFVVEFNNKLLVGQIGDGLIVINTDQDTLVFCEEEEFYSTETYALGELVRKSTFRIKQLSYEKYISLYMVTDGIGKELAEESRIDLCHYMKQLVNKSENEIMKELESWIHTLDKKNGDDKSIGILTWEV